VLIAGLVRFTFFREVNVCFKTPRAARDSAKTKG